MIKKIIKTGLFAVALLTILSSTDVATMQKETQKKDLIGIVEDKTLNEKQKIVQLDSLLKEENVDIDARNTKDYTALMIAAKNEELELVKFLVQHKANVQLRMGKYPEETALFWAITTGNLEMVKVLVEHGVNVKKECSYYKTALQLASTKGDYEIVKFLIEQGVKINSQKGGITALHYASKAGNSEIVKLLINNGAKIYLRDSYDKTPLHYAAENGNLNTVKILVESGSNINATSEVEFDDTALSFAAQNGHYKIVAYLTAKGAIVNPKCRWRTPLMYAAENGCLRCIKILIKYGADIHTIATADNVQYGAAINLAASESGIFKFLMQQGADMYETGEYGYTAYYRTRGDDRKYADLAYDFYKTKKNLTEFENLIKEYCTGENITENIVEIYNLKHLGTKEFIEKFDTWLKSWAQDKQWIWFELMKNAVDIKNKLALLPLIFPPIRSKNMAETNKKVTDYALTIDLDDLDETIAIKKNSYGYIYQNRLMDVVAKGLAPQNQQRHKLCDCNIYFN